MLLLKLQYKIKALLGTIMTYLGWAYLNLDKYLKSVIASKMEQCIEDCMNKKTIAEEYHGQQVERLTKALANASVVRDDEIANAESEKELKLFELQKLGAK